MLRRSFTNSICKSIVSPGCTGRLNLALSIDAKRNIKDKVEDKITSNALNQDVLDIRKHLNGLDEKYKIVLNALFFEGMTQQEASEELDIPLGTIKSRLKIGLRELRKIYNP